MNRASSVAEEWLGRVRQDVKRIVDHDCPAVLTSPPTGTEASCEVRFATSVRKAEVRGAFGGFSAQLGELARDGDTLHVGLGDPDVKDTRCSIEQVRQAAFGAGQLLPPQACRVLIPAGCESLAEALIDGLWSGCRTPDHSRLLVAGGDSDMAIAACRIADSARFAATLTSAPPNVLTPEACAALATEIADQAALDCEILGPDEVRHQGFGGLAAIGAGSIHGPHLVRLSYRPANAAASVALVGKGITIDSGGLSLKPPGAMQNMRMDMAGAAVVLAVMAGLATWDCAVEVHAVMPFAENLPGSDAARPGDVVRSWSGTDIQLLDTDFEGRVILADALALAASLRPGLIVDLATLTNAAVVALGPEIAAVIGRDQEAVDALLEAAAEAGEPMWQLPWAERYLGQVRTPFGVRNHPLTETGRALTAALFLGEFVPPDIAWVHCDLAGPAWHGSASDEGGTGFATRTLRALLQAQVRPTAAPVDRSV